MTTDFSPSIEQLQLLGYQQDELAYYRAIADNKSRKLSGQVPVIPSELDTFSKEGFNIYLVVNGGGDKDADVVACKAIFYEHDDRPKEDQLLLWKSLELPEPTFQIDTGGKSIHSYWVFDEPVAVDLWKPLQTDLLNHSKADRTIKNPSRVMRLAGFKHQKTDALASIVSKSGTRYSYDLLRGLVPPTPVVVRETKQKQKDDRKPQTPRAVNTLGTAIPLENCLAHSNRDLLRGVSEGGRNDSGATLARDLIGTANYLDAIGTLHIGDARSLFNDFCTRCSPSLDDVEAQTIWDSAEADFPEPSCPPDAIANILNAWNKEYDPNYVAPTEDRKLGFYTSHSKGLVLVHMGKDVEGEPTKVTTKIGNHLEAIAYLDNPEGTGAAILLEFKTVRNQIRKISISRSDLAGDGVPILSYLMGCGYYYHRKHKTELLEYLHGLGAGIEQTYTIVDSTGWVNGRYISQHKTYGDGDYVFQQAEMNSDAATEIKGTLQDWKTNVGAKCDNNSRLIFILGIAFAAPLLAVTGLESGGFHLMGDTSTGKTTAVKVAVSVTGEKEIPNWRTTANGLEMTATAHNHSLLPLDEIGQADEKGVGEACYMLRNGQGKSRSTKDLKARKVKTWRLLFLSTGEHSLASYMAQAGKVQKGGQEVGMPDIPAVPFGSPYGLFESIHSCESSKEFAENLEAACQKYRGTAIDAFLTHLVANRQEKSFDGAVSARVFKAAKKLSEGTKDHAVSRVANRFALVQVALEIAHSCDILPFPVDRIEWAVKKMFADWMNQRGGDGSIEIKKAIENIQHLLTVNEFSDRVYTRPNNDNRPVRNLLAYRTIGVEGQTEEFLIPPSVFDREFSNGANKSELVKELQRLGLMLPPRSDGKSVHVRVVNNKRTNVYVFPKREKLGDTGDTDISIPVPDAVLPVSPEYHQGKTAGDTGDTCPTDPPSQYHQYHQGKIACDTGVDTYTSAVSTGSSLVSPVSPVSPPKTQLENPKNNSNNIPEATDDEF
jgi:uncharacterized protein (DUF927 family)